ncbi:DUF2240 family protein [Candidatus Woesearchaeota archaeon]|nr:DUF2240 family protein [Candidatus Woesearchaeota archaeon]
MKIPYDKIISKIKEQTQISEEELNSKIKEKMDQLSGLISKEGAAHIIANELKIKLFEEGRVKIKDLVAGMRSAETVGKITNIFELREFQRKDGSTGKVASFIIADETGRARIVLWNDRADIIKDLATDNIVYIKNGLTKENNSSIELHMNTKSELIVNPENEKIEKVASQERPEPERKAISSLTENDSNIELLATIVQIFEPRFYEVDPDTGKRIRPTDGKFYNQKGKEISPAYSYVMNAVLDDGSSTIRAAFFRNQLTSLLKINNEQVLKFKDSPGDFEDIKQQLLGKIIKIVGRASKNDMFDRIEFIPQLVFPDPNPDEELSKLKKEAKVIE